MTLEDGRRLADEFGLRFLETSAKANEGVEEAFFTLARCVAGGTGSVPGREARLMQRGLGVCRDIKTRLIDSQPDAANSAQAQAALGGRSADGVQVGGANKQQSGGCC